MTVRNEWFFPRGSLRSAASDETPWEAVVDEGIPGWRHTGIRIAVADLGHDDGAHELQILGPGRRIALHRQHTVLQRDGFRVLGGVLAGQLRPLPHQVLGCERLLPAGILRELREHIAERAGVAPLGERRVVVVDLDALAPLPVGA